MTQAFGLLGPMCSSLNDLNYYKRVTFLSVHMPGHCRELGSFPEPRPITEKDLPELASVQASMTQVIGLFGSMCSSLNGFNYYKRVTFFICSHARSLSGIRIISGTHASDQEGLA